MDPPANGDELARVVPLRRRDREPTAASSARGTLPRERAPFDPEIESSDVSSTARRQRPSAIRAARSALRTRRASRSLDEAHDGQSRRRSPPVVFIAPAAGALATVAVLVVLASLPKQSSPPSAAHLESSGGGVIASALRASTADVLSATDNPLVFKGQRSDREAGRLLAIHTRHASPTPTTPRPARKHASSRALSINHRSAVVASYTPQTSTTNSRSSVPETSSAARTISTPPSESGSTRQQSSGRSTTSSSSGSSSNRPAFGEQGLLGPGSSPDS
jgi:hypothetical protein